MQEKRKTVPLTQSARAVSLIVRVLGAILYVLSVIACTSSLAMCLVSLVTQDLLGMVSYALVALLSIHITGEV